MLQENARPLARVARFSRAHLLAAILFLSCAGIDPGSAQDPGRDPSAAAEGSRAVPIVPNCRSRQAKGEIVVCGRPNERSPYRLPMPVDVGTFDPNGPVDSVS